MNAFLCHLLGLAGFYLTISLIILGRLAYLVKKHKIKNYISHPLRTAVLDAFSWPYCVLRYGLEDYLREIL